MTRLSGAMLFVADLPAMTAFYRDVVGFTPIEDTRLDDWIEFDTGETRFALHAIPAHLGVAGSPSATINLQLCVSRGSGEPAAARDRLAAAGATILERPWGGWDFADLEGNVLGVAAR